MHSRLLTVALVIVRAAPLTIWMMRGVMFVTLPTTLFGVWEHLDGNMDFQREIRPNVGTWEQLNNAIHGAAPLMAPGILALAAGVALIATYAHPALKRAPVEDAATVPPKPRVVPQRR